jgi:hypothetical protein
VANSLEITTKPANFFGTMSISSNVGSLAAISAPSAVHAAVGSAVTRGTRRLCAPVCTTVEAHRAGLGNQRLDDKCGNLFG